MRCVGQQIFIGRGDCSTEEEVEDGRTRGWNMEQDTESEID